MNILLHSPKTPTHSAILPVGDKGVDEAGAFANAAIANAKKEGLILAVRARWIALAVIAIMLPIVNPNWEVLYFHFLLVLFALIGWAQLKVGTVGLSRLELALMFCDLALMTIVTVIPNPLSSLDWPVAMQYRYGTFVFFFVLLAGATLSYSWRTVIAMGTWTAGLWSLGLVWSYWQPNAHPELTEAMMVAIGSDQRLLSVLDPNALKVGLRIQEMVVFLIAAVTLAITVKRSGELLRSHAALERERTNLARYFSPNIINELSHNDEPLKQVRTQEVAVLFVDIVGFTAYSNGREPEEVIRTLREFLSRMEREVFLHNGTLDKYLGDGLMATFGTPFTSDNDAGDALRCAQAMITSTEELNRERMKTKQPAIKASFGLHYGPVVLGDIGVNRLEFAVIGNTVNTASRLESLTRKLGCVLVASESIILKMRTEVEYTKEELSYLVEQPAQAIRGLEHPIVVWVK